MKENRYFNNKKTLIAFILYILITAFIFSQSLTSGESSTNQSGLIGSAISSTVKFFSGDKVSLKDNGKINSLYPEKIKVDKFNTELKVGESVTLSYKLMPEGNYTLSEVEISVSNQNVICVDEFQTLKAIAPGSSTVTFKDSFSGVEEHVTVVVNEEEFTPTLSFKEVSGFDILDNNVYYSTLNHCSAIYAVDFNCSLSQENLSISYDESEISAVLSKNKVYFYPRKIGEVSFDIIANYDNVFGKNQTKKFNYSINVLDKDLPAYNCEFVFDDSPVTLKTNQEYLLETNLNDYSLGLEGAQKRLFYTYTSNVVSVKKEGYNVKITPNKTGEAQINFYYVHLNKLVKKTLNLNVLQGVPNNVSLVTPNSFAQINVPLNFTLRGDNQNFNSTEFDWSVDKDFASVSQGVLTATKKGKVTVTATHKTIDGFFVSKTIDVDYSYSTYIRKLVGHFSLFLLLALFAFVVYYRLAQVFTPNKKMLFGLIFSLIVGVLTAGISELLQSGIFVSGRTPSFYDVILDTLGYIIGLILHVVIYLICVKAKNRKHGKTNR